MPSIEPLLSARLFLSPQRSGNRVYFISNLSGRLSLHAMNLDDGRIEALLPPTIALQTPALMSGYSFKVLPRLKQILVMIDRNGDENHQPCIVPMEGGDPVPAFGDRFLNQQVHCVSCDPERNIAYFIVDPRTDRNYGTYRVDLENRDVEDLGKSPHRNLVCGPNPDHSKVFFVDAYLARDHVVRLWDRNKAEPTLLYGTPMEHRDGKSVPLNSVSDLNFTDGERGILLFTSLFQDDYGLGYMRTDTPQKVMKVGIRGTVHSGSGELDSIRHLENDRYLLQYNIDGCSFAYEGVFDEEARAFQVEETICGRGGLSDGVLQSISYDRESGTYVAAFSTAKRPGQLYLIEKGHPRALTQERVEGTLSSGEDASYPSHDGLRISARLYLPSNPRGPTPVIFYIHGGPQGQERPNFSWFSMPLIQYFTMNGFAVFVPNTRGSTGYGLDYLKRVDHDWGGQDRLDHVEAHKILSRDPRLDMTRAGVMGRSYGGYMTLTLAGRHPELWRAACDMFGPYDLLAFMSRLPETWKTYCYQAIGHPEKDRDFLVDRSPSTHLGRLSCPLLVIQGKNDPRVLEAESADLVKRLQSDGKKVEYLLFENEGHDMTRRENKILCYETIVRFFKEHLRP